LGIVPVYVVIPLLTLHTGLMGNDVTMMMSLLRESPATFVVVVEVGDCSH
jgi:hypothetical protein